MTNEACVLALRSNAREKSEWRVAGAGWGVPAETTVPRLTGFVGPRSLGLTLVS